MEKINFNQVRGFSDSITLTFNFIKQEFKPLLRSFAVIALPVIFIGLFFMSYSARESLIAIVQPDQYAGSPLDMLTNSLLTNLSTMVIYFWMALIGIAYIRVYQDKVAAADEARITPGEVWQIPVVGGYLFADGCFRYDTLYCSRGLSGSRFWFRILLYDTGKPVDFGGNERFERVVEGKVVEFLRVCDRFTVDCRRAFLYFFHSLPGFDF